MKISLETTWKVRAISSKHFKIAKFITFGLALVVLICLMFLLSGFLVLGGFFYVYGNLGILNTILTCLFTASAILVGVASSMLLINTHVGF